MTETLQFAPAIEHPRRALLERNAPAVRTDAVYIVFTTIDETLAAVRIADALGIAMGVPLTLIHFRVVPYPLSVDAPAGVSPVETHAFAQRIREEGIDLRVRVYLCRNEARAMPMAFRGHAFIVIGGRRSWWRTPAERWRRRLEAAGHFVVFVDMSGDQPRTEWM